MDPRIPVRYRSLRRAILTDLHNELTRLEINEEASTLETLILIVEFYVKSKDMEGFQKHVRRPDKFLLTKPRPKIIDLQHMATNIEKQNLPFRAVMLHKAIAAVFKYEYERHPENHVTQSDIITPDTAIFGILQSIQKVFDLRKLLRSEEETSLYLKHFIPIMYDMLTNLREIRHANRRFRADCEAWGLLFIALIHGLLDEPAEMNDVIKTSIDVFEKRFKKNSQKHMIHGISCLTLASSEVLLHKAATKTMELGIKSLQECTEFTTWDAKVKVIAKLQDFAKP